MIELLCKTDVNAQRLAKNLYARGWCTYEIDLDSVQSDMDKLEKLGKSVKPKSNTALSLVAVARHIASIEKSISSGKLSYRHIYQVDGDTGRIVTTPYKMVKVPEFSIQTSDYIVLNNEVMVSLDLTPVLDLLAFSMCYRDLWIAWGDLEEALIADGANLLGVTEFKDMKNLQKLSEDVTFEKCKNIYCERSDFQSGGDMLGYFGHKCRLPRDRTYHKHLEVVANHAASVICDNVLRKLNQVDWGTSVTLVAVYGTELVFTTTPENVDKLKEVLSEPIEIEIHSKKIVVEPKVS